MKKHRIFIAIDVPEGLKKVAEKYIEPFKEIGLARIGENNNWHITVVFCGYLDNGRLEQLKATAHNIAEKTKSFELVPDKIIFKNGRMVWLTFKHSPEFINLAKNFIDFCDSDFRPNPHMTLVRFQQKHYPNLKSALPTDEVNLQNETRPFIVKHINIMESRLSRNGSKYELICPVVEFPI